MTGGWFDGLYTAEQVLMVLGTILFFVLIFVLLYSLFKNRPTGKVYPAFIIPIIMIGYARLQTVSFKDGVFAVSLATSELQADPFNAAKREALQHALSHVAPRAASSGSAEMIAQVAEGQFALGQTAQAESNLHKALALDPAAPAAAELNRKLTTLNQLNAATLRVQNAPADQGSKARLESLLAQTSRMSLANPEAIAQVASAEAAVGRTAQAAATAHRALTIAPGLPLALQVQDSVLRRSPPGQF